MTDPEIQHEIIRDYDAFDIAPEMLGPPVEVDFETGAVRVLPKADDPPPVVRQFWEG